MKNSLKNMVLSLGLITLIGSAAVGYVYRLTQEPIANAKHARVISTLATVLPPFEGQPVADTVEVNGAKVVVFTALADGAVVGYAVESTTQRGFGGEIRLMTGFTPAGEIIRIEVLGHTETPGFGDKIESGKSDFAVQFRGRTPGGDFNMSVRRDGGDVDAITASTVSSRAFIDAVQRAYDAFLLVTGRETAAAPSPEAAESAATETITESEGL